ncbi:MAG: Hsp20/alpha crystallin family protein [bacterium]|nr:Hsp20/alpha crystallin family protein [bacterium]
MMSVFTIDHKKESRNNAYALMASHREERPRRLALKPEVNTRWSPQISIFETNDMFIIEALVPGVDPSRISITIEGRTVVFSGERGITEDKAHPGMVGQRGNRRFLRKVKLPLTVDVRKMRIDYKDGLYLISTPKISWRAA